jgi:EAL domain-containing protein (putative c-di-GMP-specific phosphodiesterase class I)
MIGRWVLERTCVDARSWQSSRGTSGRSTALNMSVNVSAHQLMSPSYVPTVAAVLSDTGTDPALLTLEVTESVFVQDSERALVVLNELKQLGVKLALDDYGTGYSSLNYLRQFPMDVVKIDQSFVADMEHDRASHVIVFAMVELAHKLGMTWSPRASRRPRSTGGSRRWAATPARATTSHAPSPPSTSTC